MTENTTASGAADPYPSLYERTGNIADINTLLVPRAALTASAPVAPAPQPAVPEGYVLVPLEPTQEMEDAAYRNSSTYGSGPGADYRAMLAAAPKADHIPEAGEKVAQAASAVTAQGQYYDAHFASSGHRPYFRPFSARTAIAARHGTHVTKDFNALVADVVSEFMARHLATPAAPAPVAEDAEQMRAYGEANWKAGYKQGALADAAPDNRVPEAWTNLLAYALQDDMHNRLTPRVVDIAYTAFMQAKRPNDEDGGASDWFNDTKPKVDEMITKLRKGLIEELAAQPAPVAEDADPLQGAANWLVTSHATTSATELGSRLCIGYNRAERLFNAARAQAAQPEGGA